MDDDLFSVQNSDGTHIGDFYTTDDPFLILVLLAVNNHTYVGTMETEDWPSRRFIFEDTPKLLSDVETWEKISADNEHQPTALYYYILRQLSSEENAELEKLTREIAQVA